MAAHVLTEPGHTGKTYTITGPVAVTHGEIAEAIGEAIGRTISFVEVSPEDFRSVSGVGQRVAFHLNIEVRSSDDGFVNHCGHYEIIERSR